MTEKKVEEPVIVTKVDNKAAEDTITQLEKLADLTKLNELENGIDDFSDKMIQLINQNRDKLKTKLNERKNQAKTIIDQKETIIGELKSHIQQNTCARATLDKHEKFITESGAKLESILDVHKKNDLR